MTKKQKTMVVRLAVSAVFLIVGALMEGKTAYAWIPFVISYLSAGYDSAQGGAQHFPWPGI